MRAGLARPRFTTMTSASRGNRPALQAVGVLAVAALAVLIWYAWLGWDREYQVDPITQVSSGPYQAWQVIGCGASLLVVLVGALLVGLHPVWASAALTLGFTVAWTADAAAVDDTGLYGVGTVMLLVGLTAATTVISLITMRLRPGRRVR
jgi:hypothetical protein